MNPPVLGEALDGTLESPLDVFLVPKGSSTGAFGEIVSRGLCVSSVRVYGVRAGVLGDGY